MRPSISNFQAVGLAVAGYTCWVFADTSLKIAGTWVLPAYEVSAFVGLSITVLLLAHGLWSGKTRTLWPRNPFAQFLRSLLDLVNGVCVVIALRHLPLALFYILIFLSPIVTTLISAAILKEPLKWQKFLAILTGFLGVVFAVPRLDTTRSGDWSGYLACAVCVLSFSANTVWSRRMTQTESPRSLTFFSGVVTAVLCFAAMLKKSAPVDARLAIVLLAAGIFSVVGSLCFFLALRHASAPTVAQYHYSQLLTGAVIAYLVWHEDLTWSMLLGAALIIGAGLYTAVDAYKTVDTIVPLGSV